MSSNPIQTITPAEEANLIAYLSIPKLTISGRFRQLRNKLAVLLMLDAGLRVGEAASLPMSSVYTHPYIHAAIHLTEAMTKSHQPRSIPFSAQLRDALQELIPSGFFCNPLSPSDPLLYSANPRIPITTRQLERIVKNAAIKSFGRPIHPHMLRHTFATKLMRVAPMPVVQSLLGHQHLSSTQVYVHPNSQDLTDAIAQMHQPPPATTDLHT